jgi:hypothetical protein
MPDDAAIPTDRETLLQHEHDALERWRVATAGVPPDAVREDGWTFKDTVAHIGAWQRRTAARLRALDLGEPDLPPVEADEFNARVLENWRDRPWEEVGREANEARADFIEAIETVRPETFVANDALGAWIAAHNGHLHYEEHLGDEWRAPKA